MKKTLTIIGLALASAVGAQAQIAYTTGNYSQDFNTLSSNQTGTHTWTNNVTLTGWYSTATTYIASNGTSTTGSLYSFGGNATADRALGSIASSGYSGPFGAAFTNSNAFSLSEFTLTFDGEQWRRGNNSPQRTETLTFSYQIFTAGGGSINAASGWTTVSALNFTSPNATLTTASALDGNLSGNRTVGITSTVSSLSWAPTQELWIRWNDANDTGTDHGLGVDNVVLSAIPEPQTWALIGLGAAFALWRFRRRTLKV